MPSSAFANNRQHGTTHDDHECLGIYVEHKARDESDAQLTGDLVAVLLSSLTDGTIPPIRLPLITPYAGQDSDTEAHFAAYNSGLRVEVLDHGEHIHIYPENGNPEDYCITVDRLGEEIQMLISAYLTALEMRENRT